MLKKAHGFYLFAGLYLGLQLYPGQDLSAQVLFRVPQSSLDAAERQLAKETDSYRRLQLVIRWLKIVEELEKQDEEEFANVDPDGILESKKQIIQRLEEERKLLVGKQMDLDPLHRELGFRHYELRNHKESIGYFQLLNSPRPDDTMALGDAYFGNEEIDLALAAYKKVYDESNQWKAVAAYKMAWCYLKKSQYEEALDFFNRGLLEGESQLQVREESYRDRLIPYLETFDQPIFSQEEADKLRALSNNASQKPEEAQALYVQALKDLITGFTAKAKIPQAQNAFFFLSKEIQDTLEILLISAPTWLRVYRGQLDHVSVRRLLEGLPSTPLDSKKTTKLQAEIFNTAAFYETFGRDDEERPQEILDLLYLTYKKYFQLYPEDQQVDALRMNFGQMLFDREEAKTCLDILSKRGKSDKEIEEPSLSLEARCEIKYLDQLYAQEHTQEFYSRLRRVLLVDKIYTRPNLGAREERVFEALTRMLVGALQKKPMSAELRADLVLLIRNFPYPKLTGLFQELQILSAELRFQDVVASTALPQAKAKAFFAIFQDADPQTEVAKASLENSILLTDSQDVLPHCDAFQKIYAGDFKVGEAIFGHCAALAEYYLDVEREYQYWSPLERSLNDGQKLRLGLIEMALEKAEGRKRLEALKTEAAKEVLRIWDAPAPKEESLSSNWTKLSKQVEDWISKLGKISFEAIGKEVPQKLDGFEKWDAALRAYAESKTASSLSIAEALFLRAKMASQMSRWIHELPEPSDLSPEELEQYRVRSAPIKTSWAEKASLRSQECSDLAFALSENFQKTADFCSARFSPESFRAPLENWRDRLRFRQALSRPLQILAGQAQAEESLPKAKYYMIRALEIAENERQEALSYLVLARKTGRDFYWLRALELDGGLIEALEWKRNKTKGNPFYDRLYEIKLDRLKNQN